MLIQPLPAVLQPPRALRVSPAELFSSCITSAFPDVIWSLLSTWGNNSSFSLFFSFFTWEDCLSSYCQNQTIQFFCPFLLFLVVQHDPHSIPWLLTQISGTKFPCWSPGLPMPTSLSSTPQLWGVPLALSLPVELQVTGMLKSSLMDSSKPFLAFMFFHLGLASLPAYQLFLAKLFQCTFCIGHSMCHNR